MQIREHEHSNYVSLAPAGDLDANSSVYLDEKLSELIGAGKTNIHIDGSGIPYISSAGLGVFISHIDELKAHQGMFVLSNLSDSVADVFTILGLDRLDNLRLVGSASEVDSYFEQ
jgi:anti-sigma B factor antagonist